MGCGCRKANKNPKTTKQDEGDPLDRYAYLTPAQIHAKQARLDKKNEKNNGGK